MIPGSTVLDVEDVYGASCCLLWRRFVIVTLIVTQGVGDGYGVVPYYWGEKGLPLGEKSM